MISFVYPWALTAAVCCVIMLTTYTVLLFHVRRGSRNKWITLVISLLLASRVGLGVEVTDNYIIFIRGKETDFLWHLNGVGYGFKITMFNLAHYLLADKYQQIAKTIPLRIKGKEVPPRSQCSAFIYYFLLVNNILSGILFAFSLALVFSNPDVKWIVITKVGSTYWVNLCAICSGIMLVNGVWKIKKFFALQDTIDNINQGMLLRHSAAFGLYLISTTAVAVIQTLWDLQVVSEDTFWIFYFGD